MSTQLIRLGSTQITVTPAAASFATPYSSGDVIGAINTLSNAVLDRGAMGTILSITAIDLANQKSAIDLLFFDRTLANSPGADNAAYALVDADAANLLGRVNIPAASYQSSSTNNAECTVANVQLKIKAKAGSKDIFMLVVSRGTPTYGSATDLSFKVNINQD